MTAHSRARPSTTTPRSSAPTARRSRARPRRPAARTAGRRATHACQDGDQSAPSVCDDGPFGHGTGGELRYRVTVPAHGARTRVDRGGRLRARASAPRAPSSRRRCATRRARSPTRRRRGASSRARRSSRCRATAGSSARSTGASRTSPTSPCAPRTCRSAGPTRASSSPRRWAPSRARAGSARASRTTRGSSRPTASTPRSPRWRSASSRPPRTTCARCATSPTCSTTAPASSCTRRSPTAPSTSGTTRRPRTADGTKTNDFNTDETIKFPSIVALIWRWTGDDRFRDDMYDFAKRNLHAVDDRLDVDKDGWPEGSGNVERPGMGPEKLDNGVYYIRSLLDLADMARAKHDDATVTWATGLAAKLQKQFEATWWSTEGQPVRGLAARPGQHAVVLQALDRPGADGGRAHERRRGRRPAWPPTTTGRRRSRGARTPATAATAPAAKASSTPAAAAARTARATSRSSR